MEKRIPALSSTGMFGDQAGFMRSAGGWMYVDSQIDDG